MIILLLLPIDQLLDVVLNFLSYVDVSVVLVYGLVIIELLACLQVARNFIFVRVLFLQQQSHLVC